MNLKRSDKFQQICNKYFFSKLVPKHFKTACFFSCSKKTDHLRLLQWSIGLDRQNFATDLLDVQMNHQYYLHFTEIALLLIVPILCSEMTTTTRSYQILTKVLLPKF